MLLLCACITAPNSQLSCGNAGPHTYYFPAGTFTEKFDPDRLPPANSSYDQDAEDRQSYSETLDHLGAPSLSCGPPTADETYRLVWLRSFHAPVIIQVSRSANTHTLDLILPSDEQQDGRPILRQRRVLASSDCLRVTKGLEQINFWTLRPNDELTGAFRIPGSDDVLVRSSGKDGARWIIEGRADRYHVIDRWSDAKKEIVVGRIFIDLAGLSIPEEDIY